MNTMHYKGYTASINFDDEDNIFFGRVTGIRDIISFHSDTVAGLRDEFAKSIDFYLECCAREGVAPNKPMSGNIGARISPIAHSAGMAAAEREGKPFNQWLENLIARECGVAL